LVGNTTTGGRTVVVVDGRVVGVDGRGGFVEGGFVGVGPGGGGGGGFVGAVVVPVVGGGDGGEVGGGCVGAVGGGVGGVVGGSSPTVLLVVGSGLSVGSSWAPAVPVTPSAASAHSVKTMPRATFRNPLTDTPRRPSGTPIPNRAEAYRARPA
jgi:hypothetical protein